MSKKKKTSAKQTKPNLQKPAAKPAAKPEKEAQAGKKNTSDNQVKKDAAAKPAQSQPQQSKENKSEPPKLEAGAKGKAEASKKPEAQIAKATPTASKQSAAKPAPPQPKEVAKEAAKETTKETAKSASKEPQSLPGESKKKEDQAPSSKGQKGAKGGKKKNKTPRQSVETVQPSESAEPSQPAESHSPAVSQQASDEPTADPSLQQKAGDGQEQPRKVSKTLIDEDVPAPPPAGESKNVAKTLLEISIGGLKEAAAKATGIEAKAEAPQQKKVAKTMLEVDASKLRDAVEASSRAIEDEIAAAIEESEAESQSQTSSGEVPDAAAAIAESPSETPVNETVAEAPKQHSAPRQADRNIAKTMLDFRADEFFELANSEVDTLVDEDEPQAQSVEEAAGEQEAPVETPVPPQSPAEKPRRVAKTMLEVDAPDVNAPDVNAILEAARQPVPQSTVEPVQEPEAEPVSSESTEKRRPSYGDVSMEDLNEFAQALKEDKPMSPPGSRAERLRKTMLGIRKHGLVSSPSMPGVSMTGESIQGDVAAEQAPVRVSRSLHPLDNFSFDNLCPADDDAQSREHAAADASQSFAPESQAESYNEPPAPTGEAQDAANSGEWHSAGDQGASERRRTGTVEMDHNPHDQPQEGEFKGTTTVWPHDQENAADGEQKEQAKHGMVKPERFVPKTMLDMDFLKDSLSASISRAEEKLAESIAQKASEPPKQLLNSDDFKLATKNCPFAWTDNPDNPKDRVKYCTECSAQIYNFSGFDMGEAQALIFKRENRSGAPLYKREDGKFMTNDCPIALKKSKNTTMLVGGAAVILVLLVIMVVASFMAPQPTTPPAPGADTTTEAPEPPSTKSSATLKTAPLPGTSTTTTTGAEKPGTYHYRKGKGVTQTPTPPVTMPQQENTPLPGTTSGYDEAGQFWQYTDKGNN